ncbi:MAG: hypothetical protein CSA51_01430 [Gammaproteobacteria bacterium]|nr:MAG: hypothetical protein CSA51_01430 [Gammaproteobacteria bacterium]
MENINELVELDRLNIAPVIEQAGGKYDPEVRRSLRDLLSEARRRLQTDAPSAIRSSVHFTNQVSLRLHRKLGFMKIEEEADRVLFVTDGKTLCERLARFKKKTDG